MFVRHVFVKMVKRPKLVLWRYELRKATWVIRLN